MGQGRIKMRSKSSIIREIRASWPDIVANAVTKGAKRAPLAILPKVKLELLTPPEGQYKLRKASKVFESWESWGLTLAPHKTLGSGVNTCPHATTCPASCLIFAGQNSMDAGQNARFWRTSLFYGAYDLFFELATSELRRIAKRGEKLGVNVSFRGNVTSDLTALADALASYSEREGLGIYFLDYTKDRKAAWLSLTGGSLVHRVLSFNCGSRGVTWGTCDRFLRGGGTVAVMYSPSEDFVLPRRFRGHPVIDGDAHDLRGPEEAGHVIFLEVKGTSHKTLSRARKLAMAL